MPFYSRASVAAVNLPAAGRQRVGVMPRGGAIRASWTAAIGYTRAREAVVKLMPLTFEALEARARDLAGGPAHLHTTVPGCLLTEGDARPAIVLEDTASGIAYAYFDVRPIEQRARPLAVLLHGADSVPGDDEALAPACPAVQRMAERFEAGRGHFHILDPACLANPHPGRWTIVFEDEALGLLESTTDERPLDDIRVVERLIYARG